MKQRLQVKNSYLLVFALAAEIAQLFLDYSLNLGAITPTYVGHVVPITAGIAAFLPNYCDYVEKYARYVPNQKKDPYLALLAVAVIGNILASGGAAIILEGEIVKGIIFVTPWMAIHFFVAACIVAMVFITIHKISDSVINQAMLKWVVLIGALVTVAVFTPAGTVGWVIREKIDNKMVSFLIKNMVVIPAMGIVAASIVHAVLVSLPTNTIKSAILTGLEVLVATVALFAISTGFVSIIGNLQGLQRPVVLILSFLQFYIFFLAVFKIALYSITVLPFSLISANKAIQPTTNPLRGFESADGR